MSCVRECVYELCVCVFVHVGKVERMHTYYCS